MDEAVIKALLEEHNPQRPLATFVQVHQPTFLNRVYHSFRIPKPKLLLSLLHTRNAHALLIQNLEFLHLNPLLFLAALPAFPYQAAGSGSNPMMRQPSLCWNLTEHCRSLENDKDQAAIETGDPTYDPTDHTHCSQSSKECHHNKGLTSDQTRKQYLLPSHHTRLPSYRHVVLLPHSFRNFLPSRLVKILVISTTIPICKGIKRKSYIPYSPISYITPPKNFTINTEGTRASMIPFPSPSCPLFDFPQTHRDPSSTIAVETTLDANADRTLTFSRPSSTLFATVLESLPIQPSWLSSLRRKPQSAMASVSEAHHSTSSMAATAREPPSSPEVRDSRDRP
ncbi:hypothetical protein HID58_021354 [Brassica napus]|uniref:Uncharacterized protein n=1 Tax=Brassica napus TaxID=3708 RepID=A0ABQ8CYK6_BRANA|nr:hypothetical protein HID58_021354 [Brassica napus]